MALQTAKAIATNLNHPKQSDGKYPLPYDDYDSNDDDVVDDDGDDDDSDDGRNDDIMMMIVSML